MKSDIEFFHNLRRSTNEIKYRSFLSHIKHLCEMASRRGELCIALKIDKDNCIMCYNHEDREEFSPASLQDTYTHLAHLCEFMKDYYGMRADVSFHNWSDLPVEKHHILLTLDWCVQMPDNKIRSWSNDR